MILDKPLEGITEVDLDLLKATGEAEGRTLDYKLAVHTDAWDFRADISALANTSGGHLILGIEEQGGVPWDIPGLPPSPDSDAVKLRLEQILGSNIEPRLPQIGMRHVPLSNGNWCLVVRVPASWAQPHAVVRDQSRKFWARHSSGNYVMDVGQLRLAFTLSANVEERIRDFRIQRLNFLQSAGEGLVREVFHLIPISAFTTATQFDLSSIRKSGRYTSDLTRWGTASRYTLDGLLFRQVRSGGRVPEGNYALFFRNGIVEAVETETSDPTDRRPRRFPGFDYDQRLVENLHRLLSIQKGLGVAPPIFLLLTFIGVKGWSVWVDTSKYHVDDPHPIDRDVLPLTATMIEDYATQLQVFIKDTLDELWQASGWSRSLSYDEDGNWVPRGA